MSVESRPPTIAYLGLGSSLGDRFANLAAALRRLENNELHVLAVSPIYESPHMGLDPEDAERYPAHLNAVARIETTLTPNELLERIRHVEEGGGRARGERWGPRVIDVDLLLYGDEVVRTDELTVPHPGIERRRFVLQPLMDLAPDLTLPDGRAVAGLLADENVQAQRLEQVRSR